MLLQLLLHLKVKICSLSKIRSLILIIVIAMNYRIALS